MTKTTFIPVQTALRTLAAAGRKVEKLTRRQAMTLGRWDALYVVDGVRYDLAGVRHLVAGLGLERETAVQTEKPRREIDMLAEVAATRTKNFRVFPSLGRRNLNGQVVYYVEIGGESRGEWTVAKIRNSLASKGLI